MTKREKLRSTLFDKYNGRCAYCGNPLQKGWHVDEIKPVERERKWIKDGWYHKITGERKYSDPDDDSNYEWREGKWVADGCKYPENFNIDNQHPACSVCNGWKSTLPLETFRSEIAEQVTRARKYSSNFRMAEKYGLIKETGIKVVFYFETLN